MAEFSSKSYWEKRYVAGGNSGMGSYGRLSQMKAYFINEFVRLNNITSAVELGFGDGNQLSMYNIKKFIGFDVSETAVEMCRKKFQNDGGKSFFNYEDMDDFLTQGPVSELSMSIDVIFHLVEDSVYDAYMNNLFALPSKFVLIYSSDMEDDVEATHVRHRKITDTVAQRFSEWSLLKRVENPFPMHRPPSGRRPVFEYDKNDSTKSFADFFVFAKGAALSKCDVPDLEA
ncbi:MAG: hypothetical protein ACU0FO_09240 [Pseudooceanicola nanhaiensis]|uniref:hypothetical protein n=1 Tax=Pseudooceanicola nanhaiensis TaxID=375761 RepID=UPI0040595863